MRLGRAHTAIALVVVAAMASAAPAGAHPPVPVSVKGRPITGKVHRWLHQARAPLVRGRVKLVYKSCPRHPGFAACVLSSHPRRIYMRRGLAGPRRVLYHELGHVFDLTVLNRRERRAFKRIMHLRRPGWFTGGRTAAEWFADG